MTFTSIPDPSSFSNLHEFTTESLTLRLSADFSTERLTGSADFQLRVAAGAPRLIFDTRDIEIHKATVNGNIECKFAFGETHAAFGTPLTIFLTPSPVERTIALSLSYSTGKQSTAIQWLKPVQTKGKIHPYLFTQCQAIHARSLLPCQDSPAIKHSYKGELTVPKPLKALMSAISTGIIREDEKSFTYGFEQKIPIPSYLIAIAIGALECRPVGPRSHVWSEKETVDAAAWEFAETEKFIAAAETICGPYVWGIYDILVLPPSFPYGGMENPCLTFVTPTLLAGDRSLADVIAHEIAHSWHGNLVTNAKWDDFWLNEGHTVLLERKILKLVHGKEFQQLSAQIGWNSLCRTCQHQFPVNSPLTQLIPPLHNTDPDDAFSTVPYEKGFNLLYSLETLVGGETRFNPFLHSYCQRFANRSITSTEWISNLLDYFSSDSVISHRLQDFPWSQWFFASGLPVEKPQFDRTLIEKVDSLLESLTKQQKQPETGDLTGYSSTQTVLFLENLQSSQSSMAPGDFSSLLSSIHQKYSFSSSKNSEILFRWFSLCISMEFHGNLIENYSSFKDFLAQQGRMKYIRPLYREWYKMECSRQEKKNSSSSSSSSSSLSSDNNPVQEYFQLIRKNYHGIAEKMVAKDIGLE